jgi:hypothetical protein
VDKQDAEIHAIEDVVSVAVTDPWVWLAPLHEHQPEIHAINDARKIQVTDGELALIKPTILVAVSDQVVLAVVCDAIIVAVRIRAGIAHVADPVVVAVCLLFIRHERAVVDGVHEAVTIIIPH